MSIDLETIGETSYPGELRIEKGIPIPQGHTKGPRRRLLIYQLDVGDSIFIADKKVYVSMRNGATRLRDKKFTARAVEGGWRIWRVK